jgi:hypothetical protein
MFLLAADIITVISTTTTQVIGLSQRWLAVWLFTQ